MTPKSRLNSAVANARGAIAPRRWPPGRGCRSDLFVANDTSANLLFHNRGGLRFEEIGLAAGVAANAAGGLPGGHGRRLR